MSDVPNFPPGVSASSLPGFNAQEVEVSFQCEASALYVEAQGVHDAIAAAIEAVGVSLGDEAKVLARGTITSAMREALGGHWKRADEIEPNEVCGFDGEADAVRDAGVIRYYCPRCDQLHERSPN